MTVSPDVSAAVIRQSVGAIVRSVLQQDDVDPGVDLFDQGVTSLAFIRIVAQLNERFELALDVTQLEEASVDALAALVDAQVDVQVDGKNN
jgi:acyl carrier protein